MSEKNGATQNPSYDPGYSVSQSLALLAIVAAIIYAGADGDPKEDPGYSVDGAVRRARSIIDESASSLTIRPLPTSLPAQGSVLGSPQEGAWLTSVTGFNFSNSDD